MMQWATRPAPHVLATILLIVCLGVPAARAQDNVEPATTRPDSPRTNDPAEAIRVMSFNIRFGTAKDGENAWPHRREMVFDVVRNHRPDIVGMQEVLNGQRAALLRALPEYESIGKGRFDGALRGEFSPIMYRKERFEVLEHGQFWLSDTPDVPGSKSWGNAITRICTWARMRDRETGRVVYFYNTHLDHRSPPSQQRSAEMIAQRIDQHANKTDPVILVGDFNAAEDTSTIRYLKGEVDRAYETTKDPPPSPKLRDTFRVLHPDATNVGTFNGFRGESSRAKIDYVLVSDGIEVLRAAIVHDNKDGRYPSDHFPVTATIIVNHVKPQTGEPAP
ncbi:MAG: endonuclease/exonuclease/phosphatase family protein [Planctomycetes bacterium]|nr:endonuclease/exonuclease/phosphatase family protein [Planctomycetota bacterium]